MCSLGGRFTQRYLCTHRFSNKWALLVFRGRTKSFESIESILIKMYLISIVEIYWNHFALYSPKSESLAISLIRLWARVAHLTTAFQCELFWSFSQFHCGMSMSTLYKFNAYFIYRLKWTSPIDTARCVCVMWLSMEQRGICKQCVFYACMLNVENGLNYAWSFHLSHLWIFHFKNGKKLLFFCFLFGLFLTTSFDDNEHLIKISWFTPKNI